MHALAHHRRNYTGFKPINMSSNIQITKRCQWCGKDFIARTTKTAYCSHRCSGLAYKERARQKRIEVSKKEYSRQKSGVTEVKNLEFLTPTQTAILLGLGRRTIYYYIDQGLIKVLQLKRKNLIRRTDLDALFGESRRPVEKLTKDRVISEWYTTKEIIEKFGVSNSWVFKVAKEKNIPKVMKFGRTYWKWRSMPLRMIRSVII